MADFADDAAEITENPAGWLEEKMNDNDVTRITCECMEFKRSEGDE